MSYLQRQSLALAPGLRIAQSGAVDDPVGTTTTTTQAITTTTDTGQQVVDTGQQALDQAGTVSQSLVDAATSSPGWTAITAASIFLSAIHGTRRNNSVVMGVVWGAAAAFAPVIVPAIAVGQGFGKPAGGDGKKK
jgi:hypothetical protein